MSELDNKDHAAEAAEKTSPDSGVSAADVEQALKAPAAPPRVDPQPLPRNPKTELGIPVPILHDKQGGAPKPAPTLPRPRGLQGPPEGITQTQTFESMARKPMSLEETPLSDERPATPSPSEMGRAPTAPAPVVTPLPTPKGPLPSAIDLPQVAGAEIPQITTLDEARKVVEIIRGRMRHDVMGRDAVIELVLVALFGDGHVLLEDYPGSGKTTLAKALGHAIVADPSAPTEEEGGLAEFRRIQFTPDLLPSDVTGVMIFDTETNRFEFRRGPVFAYVVLVDEINRTSPKVQAALLESMAEKQVTVDNISHRLDDLFFVIATQNPLDSVGTYPLPLAQLDRFLFKIRMEHVDRASELDVLAAWGSPRQKVTLPRVTRSQVIAARDLIRSQVTVARPIHECLVDLAGNLRADKRCLQGVSTRSLVQAIPALQILAVLRGRDFVTADDIEHLAVPLFQHRLALAPGVESAAPVIADALRGPIEALSRATLKG